MNSTRSAKATVDVISTLFIFLFVYTSLNKLIQHSGFRFVLIEFLAISDAAGLLSWTIPIAELVVAMLLFIPSLRLWGLIGSLILMIVFTGFIGFTIVFAIKTPCSCGGVIEQMTWPQHFIFNSFLTVLSVWAIRLYPSTKLFIAINRQSRTPV